MAKIILVLGGGAPNLTLMSGALAALHDSGCSFDVVSMAGAAPSSAFAIWPQRT